MISDEQLQGVGLSRTNALLFGPLIRVALTACVVVLVTFQVIVYLQIAFTTVTLRQMGDFQVFYRSSQRVVEGRGDPYSADPTDALHSVNLNPPHIVLFLAPLVRFGPRTALLIWTVLSLSSAFLALWIIFRELRVQVTLTAMAWTFFALAIAVPTGALLYTAQISWLLWGPATWAWALARRGYWTRSAFVLGVLMSIKPFIALFVPFLILERRWKAAAVASATAAVCFLVGAIPLGWNTFADWLKALTSVTWADHVFNASLFGVFDRLFKIRPSRPIWNLAPLIAAPDLALPFWIVACAAVLGLSVYVIYFRHSRDTLTVTSDQSGAQVNRMFAVVLSAGLLMSPLSWIYYDFVLVGPFTGLFLNDRGRRLSGWRKILLLVAVLCFAISPGIASSAQPSGWATASIGSVYFWGLLSLWLYALAPHG